MAASHDVTEPLAALARAFAELGCDWFVFGAQAVVVWGRPRMTADLDVTALVEADQRMIDALEAAGIAVRVADPVDFARRTFVLPCLHRMSGLPIDLVLGRSQLEQRFAERAHRIAVAGVVCPVISPEDLIVSKVLAGRPRDDDDVRSILATRHVDLVAIERDLHEVEVALDLYDLVERLRRLRGADRPS